MNYKINQLSKELFLITLVPDISGFDDFIGVLLYKNEVTFLVDVGPASTHSLLIKALLDLKIENLDYIFLTHIHLDHAGATHDISLQFPNTPIICHSIGIPHLIDPTRLWEGSVKTLGELALSYGKILPVSKECLVPHDKFISDIILPIQTPGHSVHHISYKKGDYLFAGELGGVYLKISNDKEYLRPATPPRLFLNQFIESIDKVVSLKAQKI
ncbi:MAG: MBL fold metallo-hydrolase, partial [Desulfobacterales bacterium]|nr:MBL fold metallo-hydrolase [Desulfobacterales bacterium]